MKTITPSVLVRFLSRIVIFCSKTSLPLRNAGGKFSREMIFRLLLCFKRNTIKTFNCPELSVRSKDFEYVVDVVAICFVLQQSSKNDSM